jgi:hypothetical protein
MVARRPSMLLTGTTSIGETWTITQWAANDSAYVSDSESFAILEGTPTSCTGSSVACLDGEDTDRMYESDTTISMEVILNGAVNATISAPRLGVNESYTGLTGANVTIQLEIPLDNYYDNTMNDTGITTMNVVKDQTIPWDYPSWYDVTGITFNLSNLNTSLIDSYIYVNGMFNKLLAGTIIGSTLQKTTFYDGSNSANVFFSTPSDIKYVYLNITTQPFINITFNMSGTTSDPIPYNGTSYIMSNGTTVDNTTTNVGEFPVFKIDDMKRDRAYWSSYGSLQVSQYDETNDYYHVYDTSHADNNVCDTYFYPATYCGYDRSGYAKWAEVNINDYNIIGFDIYNMAYCENHDSDSCYRDVASSSAGSILYFGTQPDGSGTNYYLWDNTGQSCGCDWSANCRAAHTNITDDTIWITRDGIGSNTWNVSSGAVYPGTYVRQVTMSSGILYFLHYGYTNTYAGHEAGACDGNPNADATVEFKMNSIYLGGIGGANSGDYTWNNSFDVTSIRVFNTTTNITGAILETSTYLGGYDTPDWHYYLSPNNGTTWEEVDPNVFHVFTAKGTNLKWRVNGTVADDANNYGITDIKVIISSSSASNVSLDLGDDTTEEYDGSGTYNTSNIITLTDINSSIYNYVYSNCNGLDTCIIPIRVRSDSIGGVSLNNMTVTSSLNPISLNTVTFGTTGTIALSDDLGFSATVNDWKLYLKGDLDDIPITTTLYFDDVPVDTDTKLVDIRYSPYDLTSAYPTLNFVPSSLSSKNVQPYGQSTSIPYWNVTATSTLHNTEFYVNTYDTMPACAVLTAANSSTGTQSILSVAGTKVATLAGGYSSGIWHYLNLTSCTSGFPIDVIVNSICVGCVQTIDYDSWDGEETP